MQSYRRKCRKFRFVNSAPAEQGARTAAGVFAPNGRHLFLHRLSRVLKPRRRFTLTGGTFFSTGGLGHTNCVSWFVPNGRHLFLHRLSGVLEPRRRFTLTDGEFSAEPPRGVALCGARESAAPAAGAKRKGHLRFPFLFELLPFPCLLARRRLPTCDRSEIGYGRGFFLPCLSQPIRSVRYCTATHVG